MTLSPEISALKKVMSQEISVNSLEDQDSAFQLLMETGKYMHRLELDLEKKSPPDTTSSPMTPAMREYIGASPEESKSVNTAPPTSLPVITFNSTHINLFPEQRTISSFSQHTIASNTRRLSISWK